MICKTCYQDKPLEDFVFRKDRGRYQSTCKTCKAEKDRAWAKLNPDKRRSSKTRSDRKLRSTRLSTRLKDNLRSRLNTAIKNHFSRGTVSHVRDLGCSINEMVDFLEKQFYPNPFTGATMSWDNRGNGPGTWQIDHVVPLCKATDAEELRQLVRYSNLRPVWWEEHQLKSKTERRGR